MSDNIISDCFEEETFKVDTDNKAEWAMRKIKEETAKNDRLVAICNEVIGEYKHKLLEYGKKLDNKTGYFKSQLQQYFDTVQHEATKTQETYELPSGKLIKKLGGYSYDLDDKKLIDNDLADGFVETTKKVKWAELKKILTQKGKHMIDENGEILEGITVTKKPDTFKIDLK